MPAPLLVSTPLSAGKPRRLLISVFLAVLVLALGLSSLGIWGVQRTQQRLEAITDGAIPRVQAIADARAALLIVERDDNQVLLETDAVNFIAVMQRIESDVNDLYAAVNHYGAIAGGVPSSLAAALSAWRASQDQYALDISLHTQATLGDARDLANGPFRIQALHLADQLTMLETNETNAIAVARYQASLLRTTIITVLVVVSGIALLLLAGLGAGVTHVIHQAHRRMEKDQAELGELVEEVQMQNEEMDSQREALATALDESEHTRSELALIFSTVHEGLALFDMNGKELRRNDACTAIIGPSSLAERQATEHASFRLLTLQGAPVPPAHYPVERALYGEVVSPETYHLVRADGSQAIVQMEATPLLGAHGYLAGVLGVVRDISTEYRTTRHAEILRTLAHACAPALNEQQVAEAAVTTLVNGLGVPNCAIVVRDEQRPGYARTLFSRMDAGVPQEQAEQIKTLMTQSVIVPDAPLLTLRVIATGEAIFNRSPLPLPNDDEDAPQLMHTMAYVPLRLDGDPFGALTIGYAPGQTAGWEDVDQEFLYAVADEIATALHRAHLYAEAQQLAYTDPLTGLRNHRAMQQALHDALGEAEGHERLVSVIMLDVDHFRRFNETYGHAVGDRALQAVARAIQSAVRAQDIAARYGGEEFCVIIPGADLAEAVQIAERVRAAIAAARVPARESTGGLPVTASLGCATCPRHATQPAALLKAADLALYAAKHGGRNQVVAFHAALADDEPSLQAA